MSVTNEQLEFRESFASLRGGLVVNSDVSQVIAGGSTGLILGWIMKLKFEEWLGINWLSWVLGGIIAIGCFLLIEWIQSKSWAAFYDDVLPGKFKNSKGIRKAYRVILNLFILMLSLLCSGTSMSTSYWASEDAGDMMVEDVQMVDLGAIAKASVEAQREFGASTDSKIAALQKQVSILQEGKQAEIDAAGKSVVNKRMKKLLNEGNGWAQNQVNSARKKAAANVEARIEKINSQIREAEREKARTIRDMSGHNNEALATAQSQYINTQKRIEKKENRNKYILALICVGASFIFIISQTLLGFDRAVSGLTYQEQRLYAPESFQWLAKYFDPEYNTRSGKVKKAKRPNIQSKTNSSSTKTESPRKWQPLKTVLGDPDKLREKLDRLEGINVDKPEGDPDDVTRTGTVTNFGRMREVPNPALANESVNTPSVSTVVPQGFEYTCKNCGKKGVAKTSRKKFCSAKCRIEAHNNKSSKQVTV